MEYMKIIEKSFANAWRYRFLWIFGFFVSITDGYGGGRFWDKRWEESDLSHRIGHLNKFDIEPGIIILALFGVILLGILFWVLSVLSEGALIHGISRKESGQKTDFSDCFNAGWNRFFRLLGIILLAIFTVLFTMFVMAAFIIPAFFLSKSLGILLLMIAIPAFIVMLFIVVAVEGWAIRYGILFDKTWLDSIGLGWKLFKDNIFKTMGVAFSSFLSQLIAWILMILGLIIIAIPLVLVGYMNFWAGVLPGAFILLLVIVFSSAIFGTFASSVWTIGFMKLTEYSAESEPVESPA